MILMIFTKIGLLFSYIFIGATAVTSSSTFGQGTGPIILDDLQCTGLEYRLIDCVHRGIGIHSCSHSEDVGVRCTAGKSIWARLQSEIIRVHYYSILADWEIW